MTLPDFSKLFLCGGIALLVSLTALQLMIDGYLSELNTGIITASCGLLVLLGFIWGLSPGERQ